MLDPVWCKGQRREPVRKEALPGRRCYAEELQKAWLDMQRFVEDRLLLR